jgi:hypothetical protein
MTRQLSTDTDEYMDNFFDGSNSEIIHDEPSTCNHQLFFAHAGQGRYDVYICSICAKSWNDTGTTTYKDRT